MHSEIRSRDADASTRAVYGWRSRAGDHQMEIEARGAPQLPSPGSDESFITEHHRGYTRQRDGSTIEYHVTHPAWYLRRAATAQLTGNMAAFYGPGFGEVIASPPVSAYLAEGSAVTVSRPVRVD